MEKKFKINGREKALWEMQNKELVELLNTDLTDADKEMVKGKIIERFKYENCPHNSMEDNYDVFARQFSNFVNGRCNNIEKAATLIAKDHRFLLQEKFKLAMAFIKILANDYEKGFFDGRNEWSCKTSNEIVKLVNTL